MTKNQLLRMVLAKYRTRKEAALAIKVSPVTVSRWLGGGRALDRMEHTTVVKMCKLVGVNPDEIQDSRAELEDTVRGLVQQVAYLRMRCQELEQKCSWLEVVLKSTGQEHLPSRQPGAEG